MTPAAGGRRPAAGAASSARASCGRGRRPGALDPGGADVDRRMAQRRPDLAGEGRDRGLAVGAGDRDHRLGLRAEPQRRRTGQRRARVFGHDQRPRRSASASAASRAPSRSVRTAAAPCASAVGDEVARHGSRLPGSAANSMPAPHRAAVDGEPGQRAGRARPGPSARGPTAVLAAVLPSARIPRSVAGGCYRIGSGGFKLGPQPQQRRDAADDLGRDRHRRPARGAARLRTRWCPPARPA